MAKDTDPNASAVERVLAPVAKEQKEAAKALKESATKLTEQSTLFKETSGELKGIVKGWGSSIKSMLGPFGKVGAALGKDLKKMFTKDNKSGAAAKEAANEARRTAVKHETLMGAIAANTLATARGIKGILKGLADKAMKFGIEGLGLTMALIAAPIVIIVNFFRQLKAELAFLKALSGRGIKALFAPFRAFMRVVRRMGTAMRTFSQSGRRGAGLVRSIVRLGDAVQRAVRSVRSFFGTMFSPIIRLVRWFGRRGRLMIRSLTNVVRRVRTGISTVMGFIRSIGTPVQTLVTTVRGKSGMMRLILNWAGRFGRLLGRFFLPITIIMSVFDFVRGFMRGYKEDGIIGGIREGVAEVFGMLIGWPLNMLKKGVVWILAAFGFKDIAAKLNELDFKAMVMDLVRIPFNALQSIWTWIKLLFTDPAAAFAKLWEGMKGLATMAKDALSAIWTWITDKLAFVSTGISGAWTTVTAKVKEVWDKLVLWFEGLWTWASTGVAGTFTGIVSFITTQFAGTIQFLKDLFTWPKTPLGFVTKLIDIILLPYNLVVNFLSDIFGWGDTDEGKLPFSLGTFIIGAIGTVVTWVKEKFLFAADALIEGWTGLKTFVADAAIAVKDWIVGKFTFVVGAVIEGWTGLKEFVAEKAKAVKDWIVGKFTFLVGAVIDGWVGLKEFVAGAAKAVKDWIVGKFTFLVGAVVVGWTNLKTFIADAALAIKQWFVDKFTFAKDAVIAGWDGLLTFITGAIGNIVTWFTDKFSFAKDTVVAGWDGLLSFVTSAVGSIKQYFWNDDGKTGILQFENPVADFNPIQMVKDAITKIKEFFWNDAGTGLLQFELLGNMKLPDLSDILPDFSNPFAGIYDKIQKMEFFKDATDDFEWGSPINSMKGVLKRAFEGLFGPEKEGATGRAGGMLKPGQWAIVGEEGPELVKFKPAAQVIPNDALGALTEGRGGTIINNNLAAPVTTNTSTAVKVATALGISDPFTNVQVAY